MTDRSATVLELTGGHGVVVLGSERGADALAADEPAAGAAQVGDAEDLHCNPWPLITQPVRCELTPSGATLAACTATG